MSSFAETQHPLGDGPGGDAPVQHELEALAREFLALAERKREVSRRFDHHTRQADLHERLGLHLGREQAVLGEHLIRALIEAGGVERGGVEDWYADPSPLHQAVVGDRLFVLAKKGDIHHPSNDGEFPKHCMLVVLDAKGAPDDEPT